MPLFMDVHKGTEFTLEEVKKAHLADLQVQQKHGVRYIQYWVNDAAGMVFCLMEAPNKEACASVHQEAHGGVACNIIQVEKGDYELLMGATTVDEDDITHKDGVIDPAYRVFISVSLVGPGKYTIEPEFIAGKYLRESGGREILHPGQEILGVFNSCTQAVTCAKNIQSALNKYLQEKKMADRIEFRIAVGAGEPVTENEGLFTDTIQFVSRLNTLASKNQILLSSLVKDLLGRTISEKSFDHLFKVLTPSDEKLLIKVMEVSEARLSDTHFTVANLGKEVGMSRPQLYRRILNLTSISPNDLIRELRLKKAERMLRTKDRNISEIALEVGFSNPSYFSKRFYQRFGALPSQYLGTA
ncbi:MAG: hypothetical protein DHS20C17_34900 [Cyclobacteriaceae bacterium]|nr:MAG: hypothetical protein DHS20C17_34900 [Cyclobacteriaceae bacterium]